MQIFGEVLVTGIDLRTKGLDGGKSKGKESLTKTVDRLTGLVFRFYIQSKEKQSWDGVQFG